MPLIWFRDSISRLVEYGYYWLGAVGAISTLLAVLAVAIVLVYILLCLVSRYNALKYDAHYYRKMRSTFDAEHEKALQQLSRREEPDETALSRAIYEFQTEDEIKRQRFN